MRIRLPLRSTLLLAALLASTPAAADIVQTDSSGGQGFTVHNDGGVKTGTMVSGQVGQNSGIDAIFTGTTTDGSTLRLSSGQGQASVTGGLNTGTSQPNDTFAITSFNIALAGGALFDWIELSLDPHGAATVSFSLLDSNGVTFTSDESGDFIYNLVNGQNRLAFEAINGQSIASLSFTVTGGGLDSVKQIRISPAANAVPEPATWAMMLLGFGAAGYSVRRRRKPVLRQLA